jgi:glycerol-3-phosphate acyltransferase PlsY
MTANSTATKTALVVASYLAGTFPTADLVGRAFGRDVHTEGSGNPGTTNVYRVAGRRAAAVVLGVDVTKGALPAIAGTRLAGDRVGAACGAAAVVGHCFPLPRPSRGGKGVATAAGMVLGVDAGLAMVAVPLWVTVARLVRRPSLASLTVAGGLPLVAAARRRPRWELIALTTVAALVAARHTDNVRRLLRGEEGAPGRT